jgi:hypothetical protein
MNQGIAATEALAPEEIGGVDIKVEEVKGQMVWLLMSIQAK